MLLYHIYYVMLYYMHQLLIKLFCPNQTIVRDDKKIIYENSIIFVFLFD